MSAVNCGSSSFWRMFCSNRARAFLIFVRLSAHLRYDPGQFPSNKLAFLDQFEPIVAHQSQPKAQPALQATMSAAAVISAPLARCAIGS